MSALNEYTKLKYAGDCKCGECQLVPVTVVIAADAAHDQMLSALQSLQSFVAVMVGRGPEATIPDTITTPLGVPVKIGAIMRDVQAAIAKAEGRS